MSTRTVGALLFAVLLLAAGCGGESFPPTGSGASRWGQVQLGSVDVSAAEPDRFESSEYGAYPAGEQAWRSMIVVTNHSRHPFSLASLQFSASADGSGQREVIDPSHGCNGIATAQPVLPGETRGVAGCWVGQEDRRVEVNSREGLISAEFADPA